MINCNNPMHFLSVTKQTLYIKLFSLFFEQNVYLTPLSTPFGL